jgi:hypothetical protein
MAASGLGKRLIARRLNQEKVPTFGKASCWGRSYVQKILFNRSRLIDVAEPKSLKKSEEKIAELQLSIARSEAEIQILVDALVDLSAPAVALNDRLLKLETQVQGDKAQLEDSQAKLIEAKGKNRDFTDQAVVFRQSVREPRFGDPRPTAARDSPQGGEDRLLVPSRPEYSASGTQSEKRFISLRSRYLHQQSAALHCSLRPWFYDSKPVKRARECAVQHCCTIVLGDVDLDPLRTRFN